MTAEEYNKCVDLYSDNIYRFVLKHLKNGDAAKDVVQDTFTKVWVKKDDIDAAKAKSYLFTTAHYTIIDVVRKNRPTAEVKEIENESFQSQLETKDMQEILNEELNQ